MTLKLDGWIRKTIGSHLHDTSSFFIISKPSVNLNWSYSPKMLNFGYKNGIFMSHLTLKFDGWPWKTIRHPFCATLRLVPHFVGMSQFKLELQVGSTQFDSKRRYSVPCDFEILRITFKNNSALLIWNPSCSPELPNLGENWWFFLSRVMVKFDGRHKKSRGHVSYTTSS